MFAETKCLPLRGKVDFAKQKTDEVAAKRRVLEKK